MILRRVKKAALAISAALFVAVLFLTFFGGAETASAETGSRYLYLVETAIDTSTGTAYAFIGLNGEESDRLKTKAMVASSTVKDGAWYYVNSAEYSYPYAELFGETELRIALENRLPEYAQYSELKLIAVYDTVYKRLTSNGSFTKNGNKRTHRLELSEENNTLRVSRSSANTANWYTLLVSCGLIFIAAAITAALAVKGRAKWKRTKE